MRYLFRLTLFLFLGLFLPRLLPQLISNGPTVIVKANPCWN